MRNIKCSYCEEYRNEWCEKVVDSPHPDILRDCQYFHEAKTRWIPCSEQLPPEEKKTYWVCTDNGHQHECRWTNANPIWTNLTKDWHWNIFDIPQYTKVVA